MKHLDLCSGIGGFALAARWAGIQTVGFCEIEDYPRRVLAKNFPGVPIHHDIHDLDGKQYGAIDLITAGYPCQPFSVAGKRRGAEDDRHIWPQVLRIVTEARPAWTLFENVFGHVSMGLDEVLSDLETEGYATRTFVVPACAVDAPHRRDRVWIVGYSNRDGQSIMPVNDEASGVEIVGYSSSEYGRGAYSRQREGCVDMEGKLLDRRQRAEETGTFDRSSETVADTGSDEREGRTEKPLPRQSDLSGQSGRGSENLTPRWATEPDVGRVAHGIPKRVDRIRGLGNAIVPQVAYRFMRLIRDEYLGGEG
jgi:DNA (cytosine-5)-methyltransferase 1